MQSKTFQIETLGKNYTLAQDCCIHNDNVIFKIEKKNQCHWVCNYTEKVIEKHCED